MKTKKSKYNVELLAPAGSFSTLQAGINAGCDAIYFGISDFNMRATAAANFLESDLEEIASRCHEANIRCYMTLNTVMYNEDIDKMRHLVDRVKESGIDAIIASDVATIIYAKEKDVEVHISTQVSISNTQSVKFFAKYSDRMVLARELNLEQVSQIIQDIEKYNIRGPKGELVEIEVFAHGAMCVAVSGRCAMSLYCYNSSANKGKCSQMCRRPYKVTDLSSGKEMVVDNNYVMSASDLCTIGMLDSLLEAGVKVLKFEGRGRSEEYVDTVISTYKNAIDSINQGTYTKDKINKWSKDLKTVFNRGQNTGFYMGRKFDEWAGTHGSKSTKERIHIGIVEKYYPKINVAQIKFQAKDKLKKNDDIIIIGDKTGIVKAKFIDFLVNDKSQDFASQDDIITIKLTKKVRKNDQVYVIRDRKQHLPKGREDIIKKDFKK